MEPPAPRDPGSGAAPPSLRPFEPTPRKGPSGCGKPLWIGCGILLLVLGAAAVVLVVKAKDLLDWVMARTETEVAAAMPPDVTAEEKQRLERGFDAAREAILRGEVEQPALNALQKQLMNAVEKAGDRKLTRDDVLDLLSALERVGGLLPADDEDSGEPEPEAGAPPAEGDP